METFMKGQRRMRLVKLNTFSVGPFVTQICLYFGYKSRHSKTIADPESTTHMCSHERQNDLKQLSL